MERTLCLVKPDGVERGLIGAILARIEDKGLKIVGLKMLQVSPDRAAKHYQEHSHKVFYPKIIDYITDGPLVALCLEGHRAVQILRNLVGKTDPAEAAVGTIRGDYGLCKGRNLIHASDSPGSAEREIAIFFEGEELFSYDKALDKWVYRED